MRTNDDAQQLIIYQHTFIMFINYDVHKIVNYKYILIMLTSYNAQHIRNSSTRIHYAHKL